MMPSFREQLVHQLQCQGPLTETGARELADAAIGEGIEAYPGELAMARGLIRTLRTAARNEDLATIQQALTTHASDDAEAREKATACAAPATPFFQPGHTYTREHHGRTIEFLIRSVDTAPGSSYRVARGWRLSEDGDWEPTDSDDLTGWTDTAQGDSK